ncbi:lecithin retinol acyltransferase family protein, partial [Escherichia coli]|uniref:lecithin retinol acyltransferase family protein n=5 Tax=Gammaproteobacteria TaxID=1236 RepID=UPI002FBDF3FC
CILSCVDEPAYGGIVQCELLFGLAAHSGIYVGNGDIVHLDGDGTVIKSKAKGFLDRLDGWNSAISVYTDCMDLTPQGCARAAERAKAAVGQHYPYSLLDFNCHRFTARCVTGDSCPDIWLARHLDSFQKGDRWRVWQR